MRNFDGLLPLGKISSADSYYRALEWKVRSSGTLRMDPRSGENFHCNRGSKG